jgi:hypothetical protein
MKQNKTRGKKKNLNQTKKLPHEIMDDYFSLFQAVALFYFYFYFYFYFFSQVIRDLGGREIWGGRGGRLFILFYFYGEKKNL